MNEKGYMIYDPSGVKIIDKVFIDIAAAKIAINKFCKSFHYKKYYIKDSIKIPIENLAFSCKIVEIDIQEAIEQYSYLCPICEQCYNGFADSENSAKYCCQIRPE